MRAPTHDDVLARDAPALSACHERVLQRVGLAEATQATSPLCLPKGSLESAVRSLPGGGEAA